MNTLELREKVKRLEPILEAVLTNFMEENGPCNITITAKYDLIDVSTVQDETSKSIFGKLKVRINIEI